MGDRGLPNLYAHLSPGEVLFFVHECRVYLGINPSPNARDVPGIP